MTPRLWIPTVAAALIATALVAPSTAAPEQKHPDVLAATVRAAGADRFDFDVTVSSPYDSAARYADGIRARSPDGRVYGERKLLHDHATEQPFTRDLHGVEVPPGVGSVVVEARDQRHGYGGKVVIVRLPGRQRRHALDGCQAGSPGRTRRKWLLRSTLQTLSRDRASC